MAIGIEFLDRKSADAHAERAIELLQQSGQAAVDAWFELQAVADLVVPASNVGIPGISWGLDKRGYGAYQLRATCVNGMIATTCGSSGARTIEEARDPERLRAVKATLDRRCLEMGGRTRGKRPNGTQAALLDAVAASARGRRWIDGTKTAGNRLMAMVRVADAYGRHGVNPDASFDAHRLLMADPDRVRLIREFPTTVEAETKAISRRKRISLDDARLRVTRYTVSPSKVARLAIATGISRSLARSILEEIHSGRDKDTIIAAVERGYEIAHRDGRSLAAVAA